jgi:tetratricopeptide (TPR) repeat protein
MLMIRALAIGTLVAAVASGACTLTRPIPADVRVPPELMRGSGYGQPNGEPLRSRYVVRMTDGQRDWEIQLPEIATAYEVKVPLSGKPATRLAVDMATMTAADREILQEREAAARAETGEPEPGPGKDDGGAQKAGRGKWAGARDEGGEAKPAAEKRAARKPGDDKPQSAKASYLLTLARVKDLYRSKQYELALVELTELDRQYPDDEHILSMKGSLYERLGNKNLAREAWQQTLRINPYNLAVLEALQRLGK